MVNVFLLDVRQSKSTPGNAGLNPYSGGKCIPIGFCKLMRVYLSRLNPYSGGKCIPM